MPDSLDVSKLNDHELLLVLHTKFDVALGDLKELKEGTAAKLASLQAQTDQLEKNKASKVDVERVSERIDRSNTRLNMIIGGLIVVNVILPFILKYIFK